MSVVQVAIHGKISLKRIRWLCFFQSRFSVAMIRQTVLKQATEKTWRNDLKWTNKIQVYDVFRSQCGDVKNSFVVTYSLLHF